MEKRAIIAVVLSIGLLLVWQAYFMPKPQPAPPGAPTEAVSEPADDRDRAAGDDRSRDPLPEDDGSGDPVEDTADPGSTVVEAGFESEVVLETDRARVVLTNRGARVKSWTLLEYHDPDGNSLELVPCLDDPDGELPLALDLDSVPLSNEINDALFAVDLVELDDGDQVTFTWADGRGIEVRKTLRLRDGDYIADLELDVRDRGRSMPARIAWGPGFQAEGSGAGKGVTSYYNYSTQVVYNIDNRVEHVRNRKIESARLTGEVMWAGLEDQYFAALVLPGDGMRESNVRVWDRELARCSGSEDDDDEAKRPFVSVEIPSEGGMLFVGPKKYTDLRDRGYQLDRAVWFSSYGLLYVIAEGLFLALLWIQAHLASNWGIAIILATFALRAVLFPLNQFAMVRMRRTQAEMQGLQPKLNAIKSKYRKKKDAQSRQAMNEEIMKLYRKEGINPAGGVLGCFPLLLQFPILFGFYSMLTVAIEMRGAPFFGWITDLSVAEPIAIKILPLVMGITMFAQQKLAQMKTKTKDPQQQLQQQMMMIMPFMFTFISWNMPSGMVLYWLVNNVLGIGQQWLVNKSAAKATTATATA